MLEVIMQEYKISPSIKVSKLKLMRIKKGLKQSELSERSGIPVKSIGNYEQLRRNLNHSRADIIYRLAVALDCPMEELLDLDDINMQQISPL